jgi:NAD(P)-dependent dehydrogenase (short-subunit alcohol dehydrogenase family)
MAPNLPSDPVALWIGGTSGIGQASLQHFVKSTRSPRIYSVARPQTVSSHQPLLSSLRETNPSGTYTLITADVSLVSEVAKIANFVKAKETRLDLLFMSAGFQNYTGRRNTREGLDPCSSTRYYSRLRAVQLLLPLLNNSSSPRIVSVLAGGKEAPLKEDDLDLRIPENWSTMGAAFQATTMGTLSLERFARNNPKLSIVHWFPGMVDTPGLARARQYREIPPGALSQEASGERGVWLATNETFDVQQGEEAKRSDKGKGIFLVDEKMMIVQNEGVLGDLRSRGVDEKVWKFTLDVFAECERIAAEEESVV